MSLPTIYLNKNQERRILAGHLWIYSNEIDHSKTPLTELQPGALAVIISQQRKPLGIAYFNPHTLLCGRILTRNIHEKIDQHFFTTRLRKALTHRQLLFTNNYYRWIFSESDELPGLILDRFDDVVVGQLNTAGMDRLQQLILTAIVELITPKAIIWRNDSSYRSLEQLPKSIDVVYGALNTDYIIRENNCEFFTSISTSQKTGWFYDHRHNRHRIAKYVKNKQVLDVFSYIGAFAIPIAKAQARSVICVDSSAAALKALQKNAEHNQVFEKITLIEADAFTKLKEMQAQKQYFDVIIIDPPAFIKKKKEYHQGLHAYQQLNQLALSLLNPNGILLSASCSMQLSTSDLLNCIRRASVNLKRHVQIIEQLHQGEDHPIHPAIEETNYLKGFICICG